MQDRDENSGSQQIRRGLEQRLLQRVLVLVVLSLLRQHGHTPPAAHRLRGVHLPAKQRQRLERQLQLQCPGGRVRQLKRPSTNHINSSNSGKGEVYFLIAIVHRALIDNHWQKFFFSGIKLMGFGILGRGGGYIHP